MAQNTLGQFASILPVTAQRMFDQTQREAVLPGLLDWTPETNGDKMGWYIKVAGQNGGPVNFDGGAMLTAASDIRLQARLAFGNYSYPIYVSDALRFAGNAAQGDVFADAVLKNMMDAMQFGLSNIAKECYTGSGSIATGQPVSMFGLSDGVRNAGVYAGLDPSTYPDHASYRTVAGTGSTDIGSFTLALAKNQITNCSVSGASPPNIALVPSNVWDTVTSVVDAIANLKIDYASTAGGQFTSFNGTRINSAFRTLNWGSQNLTFVEDPLCQNSRETNPFNVIYFINTKYVHGGYQPQAGTILPHADGQAVTQNGNVLDLPVRLMMQGRTGYYTGATLDFSPLGVRVERRNACGYLCNVK